MSGNRLAWYARRLASMSPPELAHRAIERAKQFADSRRTWSWDGFAFKGEIAPLAALDVERAPLCLTPDVERDARAILSGDIELLGSHWPEPSAQNWWRTDLWTLDPVSGAHWPGRGQPASKSAYRHASGRGDVKLVWEINRLQFLMPLAFAAHRDRDSGLAAQIAAIMYGWMDANPPFQGVNWTNGIEAASRVIVALVVNTLIGPLAPASFGPRLRQFLGAHVWMLARYPSLFSSANNHRVAEVCALYLAYLSAPNLPNAENGRAAEARALEREVLRQFHADGVGAEQSPTYAAYSLEWFLLAALCGEAEDEGFSPAYQERLRAAATHLRWMMDESGRMPAIGDDDEGRVCALGPKRGFLYPAAVCSAAARWLQDGSALPPAQSATLLDAFVSAPTPAISAPTGQRTFADGGYSVWRAAVANDVALLVFDHAPLGFLSIAAHGHADALSVWLHVGAEPLIVDAGTFLYHTDNGARDRFRGTLAHNTLALDEQNQSQIAGPFNWARHAKARLRSSEGAIVADHDGYLASHGVRHQRSVKSADGRTEISDKLEGTLRAPCSWSAGLTFHPSVRLRKTEDGAEAILASGLKASITAAFAESGVINIESTRVSPRFGEAVAAERLVASGRAAEAGPLVTLTIELGTNGYQHTPT